MEATRRLSEPEQRDLAEDLVVQCHAHALLHRLTFNAAFQKLRVENRYFAAQLAAAYGGDLER